jgi:hypothetical protein
VSGQITISQPFTITVTVTPTTALIALSNTSLSGPADNAGALIGAITVTTTPSGQSYPGTLSLSGTDAAKFLISNNGTVPCGLYVGAASVAAGTYNITIVGS